MPTTSNENLQIPLRHTDNLTQNHTRVHMDATLNGFVCKAPQIHP